MSSICVFSGSSNGYDPQYREAAVMLGSAIANAGHTLVYGGASVGLMGVLADSALQAGGEVIGVLPRFIADVEVAHEGLTQLHLVDGMMSRKQMLIDISDAFITIPGGLGTLDELFEVWSWRYLGLHDKPLGLLNTDGFYDGMLSFLQNTVTSGFVKSSIVNEMIIANDAETLLNNLMHNTPATHSIKDKLHGISLK